MTLTVTGVYRGKKKVQVLFFVVLGGGDKYVALVRWKTEGDGEGGLRNGIQQAGWSVWDSLPFLKYKLYSSRFEDRGKV